MRVMCEIQRGCGPLTVEHAAVTHGGRLAALSSRAPSMAAALTRSQAERWTELCASSASNGKSRATDNSGLGGFLGGLTGRAPPPPLRELRRILLS